MTVRIQRHLLLVLAGLPQPRTHPSHGRRCIRVLDGTLIPVHDQQRAAVSKNHRRSVNVQLVIG
ncbi:MAG TPA: hypothetical protein VL652_03815, partial [Kutzneria sp.]|nr:hypothetical protein [Kutzneria sp.]